jgi:AraC family transcriptional regulator
MHRHSLFASQLVTVSDLRCRNVEAAAMPEEESTSHQVVLVRAGMFVKHVGSRRIVAEPAHVLFFNKGETFRVSHPSRGDDCTAIACSPALASAILSAEQGINVDCPDRPFSLTHSRISPSALIRYHVLRAALRDRTFGSLEAEELTIDLLHQVVREAYRTFTPVDSRSRRGTTMYRQRIVEETKVILAADPSASFSLAELARRVACSPFHLSRIFRSQTGMPVHQYLLRLRLALALERLSSGSRNLSQLGLSLGFASHSHFTTSFRQTFGISPSAFRHRASTSCSMQTDIAS